MTGQRQTDPQELLEQIRSFITLTHAHLREGGDVDMTGLDAKVQELCEAVLDMPRHEADIYGAALEKLAGDLTGLKAEMEAEQKRVREQLDKLNLRHKAAKAYKTTEAVPAPPKSSED